MQRSNTIVQGSFSLRQAFAAMGILVALAITVPIFGILMIPAVALGTVGRVLVDAMVDARRLLAARAASATPADGTARGDVSLALSVRRPA